MHKPILTYIVAIGALPMFGMAHLAVWLFWGAWTHSNWFYLENGQHVKNGGWKWFWYRLMLGYQPTKCCSDCGKIIDSAYITDLCQCAFNLDMRGMK
jgi:hypothetical protein